MKRRDAVQAILFFSVAGGYLISCKNKEDALAKLDLRKLKYTPQEIDLIDDISKTILPAEKVPEFKGHTALPFVLTMLNDCYTDEERAEVNTGLVKLEEICKTKHNKSYTACSGDEKISIFKDILAFNGEDKDKPVENKMMGIIKDKTVQYFTTMEPYMRKYRNYEMAPGRFKGCVNVNEVQVKNL
jgi:hypothetical protein